MSFLAPIFLLGAVTVGLPLLFHLVRRSTRERMVFSSLMFLSPSPPTLSRRSRLEDILLLVLRCAIICLLALAFARPFIKTITPSTPPEGSKRTLLLVDSSASMQRGDLWSQATRKAASLARQASPADTVALFTFDRRLVPLVSFEEWNTAVPERRAALLENKLNQVRPGWTSTSLGQALMESAEILSEKGRSGPGELVLISDLQEGSHLDAAQGYEWPDSLRVSVEAVKLPPRSNASLQLVSSFSGTNAVTAQSVRVRVANAADSSREEFRVGWADAGQNFVSAPQTIYVPAGSSRVLSLSVPPSLPAPPRRILLTGDDDSFDNSVFVATPEPQPIYVAYIGPDDEANPKQQLYFLNRAFQQTARQSVFLRTYKPDQLIPPEQGSETTLFIVGGALSAESARELRAHLQTGKTLLFIVTAATSTGLGDLLDNHALRITEADKPNYALLAGIEFQHPLFAPFADPRFSDFARIHFWRYRSLDPADFPQSRVLARFDTGDPALVEAPIGKGRLLVLTSGWNPQDSQLALATKFVPLLYSMLDYAGAPPPASLQFHPGDSLPLELKPTELPATLTLPENPRPLALDAGTSEFSGAVRPGIYTLRSPKNTRSFIVNLDPIESRTSPLPADELESMGLPVAASASAVAQKNRRDTLLRQTEIENRQRFWRWLILATLGVVLAETALSFRAARLTLPNLRPSTGGSN